MKAMHSADFYKQIAERMLADAKPLSGHYLNPEKDLAEKMSVYTKANVPDEYLPKLMKMEAQKIYDNGMEAVKADLPTAKRIREKKANFGYTTVGQEIRAQHDFDMRFEFNCWLMAEFKKKYL